MQIPTHPQDCLTEMKTAARFHKSIAIGGQIICAIGVVILALLFEGKLSWLNSLSEASTLLMKTLTVVCCFMAGSIAISQLVSSTFFNHGQKITNYILNNNLVYGALSEPPAAFYSRKGLKSYGGYTFKFTKKINTSTEIRTTLYIGGGLGVCLQMAPYKKSSQETWEPMHISEDSLNLVDSPVKATTKAMDTLAKNLELKVLKSIVSQQ